jgi:hypothetical protein
MGHFIQSVKRFKESWVRPSVTRQATNTSLSESIQDALVVGPVDQILELPADIVCIASDVPELPPMLLEDSQAEATCDNSTSLNGMD